MSLDWNSMQASSTSRRQKYEAEAAQSQLAQITRKRTVRIYGPVLFRLGGWLMTWGHRLQTEYGEISSTIHELRDSEIVLAKTSAK